MGGRQHRPQPVQQGVRLGLSIFGRPRGCCRSAPPHGWGTPGTNNHSSPELENLFCVCCHSDRHITLVMNICRSTHPFLFEMFGSSANISLKTSSGRPLAFLFERAGRTPLWSQKVLAQGNFLRSCLGWRKQEHPKHEVESRAATRRNRTHTAEENLLTRKPQDKGEGPRRATFSLTPLLALWVT